MATQDIASEPKKSTSLFLTIFLTWLLVGTLDGSGATINFLISGGKDPARIFQYIASAVFGKDAYSGSTGMILMGIFFHYINALLFTIFFFLVVARIKVFAQHKFLAAILYGVFMWVVMTFLVLPLTKIPRGTLHLKPVLIGISILIVALGIPLSFISSAYYEKHAVN